MCHCEWHLRDVFLNLGAADPLGGGGALSDLLCAAVLGTRLL